MLSSRFHFMRFLGVMGISTCVGRETSKTDIDEDDSSNTTWRHAASTTSRRIIIILTIMHVSNLFVISSYTAKSKMQLEILGQIQTCQCFKRATLNIAVT